MTILVTGALGFIGSNLVGKLLKANHLVIGVDNLANMSVQPHLRIKRAAQKRYERLHLYKTDINDTLGMRTITVRHKPDAIVHLAALGSIPRSFSNPQATVTANDLGFVNMIELASSLEIKKFIYASSSSVYGNHASEVRYEGLEGKCLNPYALTKKFNEEFANLWSLRTGLSCIGLRFFNVYGPGQSPHSEYAAVIPKFISSATPTVNGDGEIKRDFTYVDDICDAIMKAIDYQGSGVFNVGTGKATSLNDLLELLGKKAEARFVKGRLGDVLFSIASTEYAKTQLGFEAKTSIEEGLKKTVKFFKEQGDCA